MSIKKSSVSDPVTNCVEMVRLTLDKVTVKFMGQRHFRLLNGTHLRNGRPAGQFR